MDDTGPPPPLAPFLTLAPPGGQIIAADALAPSFEAETPPRDVSEARRAKGWIVRTVLFAALVLALLNARALQSWSTTLPPEWGPARAWADAWYARTSRLGLDGPRQAIHAAYNAKKGVAWADLQRR